MQQEEYKRTELTVTEFDTEDVITTSGIRMPDRQLYEYKVYG